MVRKQSMDMVNGPILGKLLLFALPLVATGILQVAFNAADIIVVGQFAGPTALAAVGATSPLINLIVTLFMGLAVGVTVAVSHALGAQSYDEAEEHVHNAMATALIGGLIVLIIGQVMAPYILRWMGTPEEVMDAATAYLRIYFCGSPAFLVYNYGAALMRTSGDTRRPLFYLSIAGIANVGLNLLFILGFGWKNDVVLAASGVAIATVASHLISAVLIVSHLCRSQSFLHLNVRRIRIYKDRLIRILALGIPAGLQSSLFSISNVLIQSNIFAFGTAAIAGSAAAGSVESFVGTAMDAFNQGALTFIGQNKGAKKYHRFPRIYLTAMFSAIIIGFGLGMLLLSVSDPALQLYINPGSTEAEMAEARLAFQFAKARCFVTYPMYACAGMMQVASGSLRGLGKTTLAMLTSVFGICGLRFVWIYAIYPFLCVGDPLKDIQALFFSYPFTWFVTALLQIGLFVGLNLLYKRRQPDCFIKE